ncbi:hypothetical protein JEQ12_006021 [Ovis aries]|uniref:Uncharacterized protein n=1 Tax=Ovis aries TaxID=9940 RepID=A0A836CUI7_SHEEP|nr:hypothetical protein JEQ12_006021 [Ovis aries]
MNEMESLQRKTLNTTVCFHQGGEQEVARTPKGQVSTLVRVQEPGPSSSPQMADITPLSPEEPGVNIRLYDLLGPVRELDMKRRQMVANHHVHTEHKLCKLMTHAVLTWTGDPQALGTLPPQTVSLHHQLRRKSNKELEDFHGSQALDGGRRHQAASDREPWKPRGSRDAPGAAKPRLVFGKDSEEPVNLASSLLLIISIYDVAAGKCGYENLENRDLVECVLNVLCSFVVFLRVLFHRLHVPFSWSYSPPSSGMSSQGNNTDCRNPVPTDAKASCEVETKDSIT